MEILQKQKRIIHICIYIYKSYVYMYISKLQSYCKDSEDL